MTDQKSNQEETQMVNQTLPGTGRVHKDREGDGHPSDDLFVCLLPGNVAVNTGRINPAVFGVEVDGVSIENSERRLQ
jgi:hypothetical protein